MTNELAKELFDIILQQLQENDLIEVVTFALPESTEDLQFSEFGDDYRYRSTDAEIQLLIHQSGDPVSGASRALDTLINAGIAYFRSVEGIQSNYAQRINSLSGRYIDAIDTRLRMRMPNDSVVDISARMENPAIRKVLILLQRIAQLKELNDEDFLSRLDDYTDNL